MEDVEPDPDAAPDEAEGTGGDEREAVDDQASLGDF